MALVAYAIDHDQPVAVRIIGARFMVGSELAVSLEIAGMAGDEILEFRAQSHHIRQLSEALLEALDYALERARRDDIEAEKHEYTSAW